MHVSTRGTTVVVRSNRCVQRGRKSTCSGSVLLTLNWRTLWHIRNRTFVVDGVVPSCTLSGSFTPGGQRLFLSMHDRWFFFKNGNSSRQ